MRHTIYPAFLLALLLSACSGEEEDAGQGHVWQDQTRMMEKAKQVDTIVQDAAKRQRDRIEDQER